VFAVDFDLPAVKRRRAEDRLPDVGPPRAHESREPDDLAAAHDEADVLKSPGAAEISHAQPRGPERQFLLVIQFSQLAPDHHRDDLLRIGFPRGARADEPPVAQYRDAIGDLEHLLEPMTDEHDRRAGVAQLANDAEEVRDLAGREGGRRFVHQQHPRPLAERRGQLHHLLVGNREPAHLGPRVDLHAQRAEHFLRPGLHRASIQQPQRIPRRGVPRVDVLRDVQVRKRQRLLVNQRDPVPLRILRRVQVHGLIVNEDAARVRPMHSGEDLQQRAFSRAVLAEKCVHLAGQQIEIHPIQHGDAAKALADLLRADDRARCGRGGLRARSDAHSVK
jgi:hypothetical protein